MKAPMQYRQAVKKYKHKLAMAIKREKDRVHRLVKA